MFLTVFHRMTGKAGTIAPAQDAYLIKMTHAYSATRISDRAHETVKNADSYRPVLYTASVERKEPDGEPHLLTQDVTLEVGRAGQWQLEECVSRHREATVRANREGHGGLAGRCGNRWFVQ